MEENQINESSQTELDETPSEPPLDEQLAKTLKALNAERTYKKELEKKNKQLARELDSLRVQRPPDLSEYDDPLPMQSEPATKKAEVADQDFLKNQSAKQVISGLQHQIKERDSILSEKDATIYEMRKRQIIFEAFVANGGITGPDQTLLDFEDMPFEIVYQNLAPKTEIDEDGAYIKGADGQPLLNDKGLRMTIQERMPQMKNVRTYQLCFKPDNDNVGMGTTTGLTSIKKGARVVSSEALRNGRVKLSSILAGDVVVKD